MTNRLMLSVAAIALIAGAGAVNAQGTGGRESGGASTQQSAPSSAGGGAASGGAAMQHEGSERSGGSSGMKSESKPDMKSSQSEQSPGATRNQRADEQGQKSKGMSSENETKGGMKSEGHDSKNAQNPEGRDRDQNAAQNRDRNGNMNAEGKSSTDMKSQTTTGQAGAGAKLSGEQRTKITTVIRNEHVAPVTNVNFAISVGTRVPRDVSFHPIPSEVVTIYPEWRGYNYILVRQQMVVIDPATYEIVAVLDV